MNRREFMQLIGGAAAGVLLGPLAGRQVAGIAYGDGYIPLDEPIRWVNIVSTVHLRGTPLERLYLRAYDPETKTVTYSHEPTLAQELYEYLMENPIH